MRLPYLVAFALTLAAAFAAAVKLHELRSVDFALLATAARADGRVVLFGNSINRTVSRCDRDGRTLPDMLSALAEPGRPALVNLSRGGMTLAQMLRIAEVATAFGLRPAAIVFPVTFSELLQPARDAVGWRSFVRDNARVSLFGGSDAAPPAAADPGAQPYKGRVYGSYADFSRSHFEREKREARCPEQRGVDTPFVEFMYWRYFLQPADVTIGLAETLERAAALRGAGVRVAFWFPPIDFDDLRDLHGDAAAASVTQRVGTMAAALAGAGFTVLDTSQGLPADAFADRWCACGHLNQSGRERLAVRLHDGVGALLRTPLRRRAGSRRRLGQSTGTGV